MRTLLGTIQASDLGKSYMTLDAEHCEHCGRGVGERKIYLPIGYIQPIDIGKQVYNVGGIIQVENDEQAWERITKHIAS